MRLTPTERYCCVCRASVGTDGRYWACQPCVNAGLSRLVYHAAMREFGPHDYSERLQATDDPLQPVERWIVNAVAADILRAAVLEARRMLRHGEITL